MVRTIIKKLRSFDWGGMEKEKFVPLPAISFDKLCVIVSFSLPKTRINDD